MLYNHSKQMVLLNRNAYNANYNANFVTFQLPAS